MILPLLLTTFISSTLAAPATFFTITGLDVYDQHRPTTSHLISFSISNPNAVYEQGGSDVANCTLEWSADSPPPTTCFTPCSTTGPAWYTRLSPIYNSYSGEPSYYYGNFSIDVAEYFVYKAPVLNNVSVPFVVGEGGYSCSNGAQSSVCGVWDWEGTGEGVGGKNVDFKQWTGGNAVQPEICKPKEEAPEY